MFKKIELYPFAIFLLALLLSTTAGQTVARASDKQEQELKAKKEERRQFQDHELVTAKRFTFIFNPGDPPRIVWRDVDEIRRLGSDGELRVRWFDAELNEVEKPEKPGRWGAIIEGVAPNGTPVRRAMTFFCRPPGFLLYFPPDPPPSLKHLPGPISSEVWREHESEFAGLLKDALFKSLNDAEAGVILLAGLSGIEPLGRDALSAETAAVLNEEYHLALKRKLMGLQEKGRPPKTPRKRNTPAPVLREGSLAEAEVRSDTPAKIREICKAWAEDSGEPFVTLVARRGVIVLHEAFNPSINTQPIGLDYRCDVASITKSATGILFSQFIDQGLIGLEDSVETVFPDYPRDSAHVPTFRQCLTHTSGLSGHGDWGGVRNPYLENIILNGIDVNQPGKAYAYSGMGFDLTAEAMEIVSGKSALRLYRDHLFLPLGMGDVPMGSASAGAQFTARELGVLAQWLVNRGSYGDLEFISTKTFEAMLPEPLSRRYSGIKDVEGIGIHWMKHRKPGANAGSNDPEDLIFGGRMLGHGSLSSCIFQANLENGLVVTQVRKTAGPRYGEWSLKMFQVIADSMKP